MARSCVVCGASYEASRSDSRYCGGRCQKRAQRGHVAELPVPAPPDRDTSSAVLRELEAAGRVDTYHGQSALALAHLIDNATAVMGFAQLVKELRVTMEAALAGAVVAADPLDMVRARRDAKRNAG